MLEDCPDILRCESRLSRQVRRLGLLGDIPLSQKDLDHLARLIRQSLYPDTSKGTRFLKRGAPTCLACFLAWKGITGYHDGDYWSALWASLGLPRDPNREREWGQVFLDFLEANDLPRFDVEGGLTYVTPILAHGRIPNSCLNEFFEKILLPMIQRDLTDPTDRGEIVCELAVRREDDGERASIARQYDDLQTRTHSLTRKVGLGRQTAKVHDEVIALWGIEHSTRRLHAQANLPEDYEAFRDRRLADLGTLQNELHGLERKQTRCQQALARVTEQDEQVLARADAINRSAAEYPALEEQQRMVGISEAKEGDISDRLHSQSADILSKSWDNEHGKLLTRLPFHELREEIRRFEGVVAQQDEDQQALDDFEALSRASSRAWPILPPILLFLGLILMVIGVQVLPSWVLTTTGIGFTIIAGFRGWSWYRKATKRRRQLEALEQTLKGAISKRRRVEGDIARILGDLPIAEEQSRSPSPELHQALISLADAYEELCEIRNRRVQLQHKTRGQAQHIEQIAASIGVQPAHSLADMISAMNRALEEARGRQAAVALEAKELADNVQPKIVELNAKDRAIHGKLARIEEQLRELGGGDVQAGIEQVKAQRELQDTAAKLRAELKGRYPDLLDMEREIRNAQRDGKDKAALEAETRQLTEELEAVQAQTDGVKQLLSYYPAAFPGVDEPIRRYLLHGGELAEEFLVRSVLLVHQTRTDGKVPNAEDVGLPQRVVTAFERWWTQHIGELKGRFQPDERETATGQRFRAPAVSLDPGMAEIVVHFPAQRYPASIAGTSACLEVVGSISHSQRRTVSLRVYRSTEDLVETGEHEFPLPFPAYRYGFSLESNGSVIHRWEVPGVRGEPPYMAFDGASGRLIKDDELPKGKVWFLVHQDSSLEPADCILVEGNPLYGQWKNYMFRELDLDQVDGLQILDDQGERFLIRVSSEVLPALGFVGGQRLEGGHSEGVEIYVGPPPRLRIPVEDNAELRLWRISIFPDTESSSQDRKHYRLSEIEEALDARAGKGWVDVLLEDATLLGQRPVGRFVIRVRKQPYIDWRSAFCAVPELQIEFDRDIYLPYEAGKTPEVYAKILVAQQAEFAPQPPAELLDARENLYTVKTDGTEDILRGTLCLRSADRGDQQIPLTISIPKARWRLQGMEDNRQSMWCDTVSELWFGDWETAPELFLIVALPSFVDGRLRLALDDDSGKADASELHDGRARFDLLAFGDALQAGPSVQTFTLTLPDSQFAVEHAPVFKVRTHWDAEDIECVQTTQGRTIILNVEWSEKGPAHHKVIRLWSLTTAKGNPIIEQQVAKDAQRTTMQASATDLPPGRYLLQLKSTDRWSSTTALRPPRNAPNTRVIYIVSPGDLRQDEKLIIASVADDRGNSYQLGEATYKIKIVGKIVNRELPSDVETEHVLVTQTNEGWYVGNFEVSPGAELEGELARANPVKLEYSISEDHLTAIEDREGDGAMFCHRCRKLYWSRENLKKEERRGHKGTLLGPDLCFKTNWEPFGG